MVEKILKNSNNEQMIFDYKPRALSKDIASSAVDFVHDEKHRQSDFVISEQAAQQSGVAKLENERSQKIIDTQVLEKLKEVQEKAYKEAYDLGLVEGEKKAFTDHKRILSDKMLALDQLILTIESLKQDQLKDNEAQLIELTFQIAKKLVLKDLSGDREVIVQLLKSFIGQLQEEQIMAIRVAQEDFARLEELQGSLETPIESLKKVKLIKEASLTPGGCIIDVSHGEVNLSVVDRLDRLWEALQNQLVINQKSV